MTPYRSISSYVFNHLSMLAEGQQSLAKSLFLGGVTRRFPDMNFAFLEGRRGLGRRPLQRHRRPLGEAQPRAPCAANLDPALVDRDADGRDDGHATRPTPAASAAD